MLWRPAILRLLPAGLVLQAWALAGATTPLTPRSERFVPPAAYDTLLGKAFAAYAANWNVPAVVSAARYRSHAAEIYRRCEPALARQFRLVETYNATHVRAAAGSKGYASVKRQYERAFFLALRAAAEQDTWFARFLSFKADDRITEFFSRVQVLPDGSIEVREDITVYNGDGENAERQRVANDEIQRGIVRRFPTQYSGKLGLNTLTGFELLKVERDGKKEAWTLRREANGYALYIGRPEVFLETGFYTYTIVYRSTMQLFFGEVYDELNWNVNGNGWTFNIENLRCEVKVPGGKAYSVACYTGLSGSRASECSSTADTNAGTVLFTANAVQLPGMGLTIGVSWPKGLIQKPGFSTRAWLFWQGNRAPATLWLCALLILFINLLFWLRKGRDRKIGGVFPEFEPPDGCPPALLGYVRDQGYSTRLTSATLLDMAVRGFIRIDVSRTGGVFPKDAYQLRPNSTVRPQGGTYARFFDEVGVPDETTIIKGEYNKALAGLQSGIERWCKEQAIQETHSLKGFFSLNNRYLIPGNILALLAFVGSFILLAAEPSPRPPLFFWWLGSLVLVILIQVVFYRIMPVYTQAGRTLMAGIEGFRMFLRAADEQRINAMNPPSKTPELYEKFLPFAVALDCESDWSAQFESVLDTVQHGGATAGLSGNRLSSSLLRSGSAFSSSLTGAIASASSPPSSSGGGSFGGGSSGGGGGGGGGGGW